MQCIECKNCDLQKSKVMSRMGWAFCKLTVATWYPLVKEFNCAGFIKADKTIIEKRTIWANSKQHYPEGMKIENC